MKRRQALGLLLGAGGAVILPISSCKTNDKSNSDQSDILTESADDSLMLIGSAIVPASGASPGISKKDIVFLRKKLNDCDAPDERKKFISGLKNFETELNKSAKGNYKSLAVAERSALVKELLEAQDNKEFTDNLRGRIVGAYTGGEYFQSVVEGYKLIPGTYTGCQKV